MLRLGFKTTRDYKKDLYDDDVDDGEGTFRGGSVHNQSFSTIRSKNKKYDFGIYRDDFYDELNVENLAKYYLRNLYLM